MKRLAIGDKIRGGGVALYIKNEFSVTTRDNLTKANFPDSSWCNIEIWGEKTCICNRPPSNNKMCDEAMYDLITRASREQVLIMGDFNFPELVWAKSKTLDDSHPFIECVNDVRRNMIDNVTAGEPFGSSDHWIIRFDFLFPVRRTVK